MIYTPDNWILVRTPDCVKVLAGWKGSYTGADKWRLSSGVSSIEPLMNLYKITNVSGSEYYCAKAREGLTLVMIPVYNRLLENNCVRIGVHEYESGS